MSTYIVRRLIQSVVVIFLVIFLVFAVIRLLPGDPILVYLSQEELDVLTKAQIDAARDAFGLNESMPLQYIDWVGNLARWDLKTQGHRHYRPQRTALA